MKGRNMGTFNHSGKIGDILYSLYFCKELSESTNNNKFNFHIQTNVKEKNGLIGMTNTSSEFLKPLLESQNYIDKVTYGDKEPEEEDVINLIQMRDLPLNIFGGDIRSWYYNLVVVHLPREFWKPIIQVEPNYTFKDKIIFSWTPRYQNVLINYKNIEMFKDYLVFVGLEKEYFVFKQKYFDVQYAPCSNMLKLAQYVAGARGFIGNQGGNYSLAECMKVPRVLISPEWIIDKKKKDEPIPGPVNNHPLGGWNEFAATNDKLYHSIKALIKYTNKKDN